MLILITGAAGFIGGHLARHFSSRGHEVIGCGRGLLSISECHEMGITKWYSGSLGEKLLSQIIEVPAIIIHAAGGSLVSRSIIEPYKDFDNTVIGTASVLEFARKKAPDVKIIYISTPATQGSRDNSPYRVKERCDPCSPYGFHKMMAENLCKSYQMQYGLRVEVVRIFSAYGVGLKKQLLWDACQKIKKEKQLIFWGSGNETRDWIHVADVCELIEIIALHNGDANQTLFNCGSGVAIQNSKILQSLFEEMMGLSSDKHIHFNGVVKNGDPLFYLADISESLSLGWEPKISLKTGLKEYVKWFKDLNE